MRRVKKNLHKKLNLLNSEASWRASARTKMAQKKKWSEESTKKFVELYEQQEVLWNYKLPDYKNKDARRTAEVVLSESCNVSVQEVKNKIRILRSTYAQERAKVTASKKSRTSPDEIYKPTLIWYSVADRFLSNIMGVRKAYTNLVSIFISLSTTCTT